MLRTMRAKGAAIATLLGACALIYVLMGQKMQNSGGSRKSITAVLTGKISLPIVPENISTIPLYQIHLNLWDTLVTSDGSPALATLKGTSEDKKRYRFELQPDAHFSNGRKITADDIVFSIQRLMGRQPGGHFNARSTIDKITVLSESRLEIELKEPTATFLFLLSIPEMGIVPREACNPDGSIRSLAVTSGAYTIQGEPHTERVVLTKNSHFKRHDPQSPDAVTILFRRDIEPLLNALDKDGADFMELYESAAVPVFEKLKNKPGFSFKTTRPSYSVFISLNEKRLARDERVALAKLFQEKLGKYYKPDPDLEVKSFELLPPKTFGSLGIKSAANPATSAPALPKQLVVAQYGKGSPLSEAGLTLLRDAGIEVELVQAGEATDYDMMFCGQGMNADFPEIEFYLSMVSSWAFISASEATKSLILRTIHSVNREERTAAIRSVSRSILEEGRVIPLVVRSYAHLYRINKLRIDNVTSYDGDVPFWRMQVEP